MSYKEFDWIKVKTEFGLTTVEGDRFLPEIEPLAPSPVLQASLQRGIRWAVATGNEKARSEAIITPILLEVREILNHRVSTGTAWSFLKLEEKTLTLDLTDYPVPPVEPVLGMLVWMAQNG